MLWQNKTFENMDKSKYFLKKPLLIIWFFLFVIFLSVSTGFCKEDWQEQKGEHFIVYFIRDAAFARDVLDKAEVYYTRIASGLGYSRYSEFWTWDKRVKIYIYPNRDSYLRATGQARWTEGIADYTNKRIISYEWSRGFMDALLPHEMAHLIFRDFVGFKGEVPLWLDEGVAQWTEEWKREAMKAAIKQLLSANSMISLKDMIKLDVRRVKEGESVKLHSIPDKDGNRKVIVYNAGDLIKTYYIQSVSLVGFLVERYGSNDFTKLCRELRDGKSLEGALRSTYSVYLTSISDLENKWIRYIRENY